MNIFRVSSVLSPPAMNSEITTSSSEVMKANRAPASTDSLIRGSVMPRNARTGWAPRLCAAISRLWSNDFSPDSVVTTTKGRASAVWASTMPGSELTSPSRM